MSLLENSTLTSSQGATPVMYEKNHFVGEPEELEQDKNYDYLCELVKYTPGVSVNTNRELCENIKGKARNDLERALSGTW
jgi:hypothetical protein